MFAEIWMQAVQTKNPALYQQLKDEGRLEDEAWRIDEEAGDVLEQAIMKVAGETNDEPDYMKRVQTINQVRHQTIETLIAEITDIPMDD